VRGTNDQKVIFFSSLQKESLPTLIRQQTSLLEVSAQMQRTLKVLKTVPTSTKTWCDNCWSLSDVRFDHL